MYRFFCMILVFYGVSVSAKTCGELPYSPEFIAGAYDMVARYPDSNTTFTAKISIEDFEKNGILMVERLNKNIKRTWKGHFRPASPGEECILEFQRGPYSMSCLVSIDLDNFARLTCSWGWINKMNNVPGIAALFHTVN